MPSRELLARESELAMLDRLLSELPERGHSLIIRGDPGVGKSALLAAAERRARERHWRILRTEGTPSEMRLPLAALHRLLLPVMAELPRVSPPRRAALLAAFGAVEGPAPEPFHVALAALELCTEVAALGPLVVLVDDSHWLDQSSAQVLAFVGRRIGADPVLLLATGRHRIDDPLAEGALEQLELKGLDEGSAGELLDSVAPGLPPAARRQLLAVAVGNPLALKELPKTHKPGPTEPGEGLLPMTRRLEQAFAERAASLPASVNDVLLLAALSDASATAEILAAATVLGPAETTIGDLDLAVAAGLVEVDERAVRFRHPLVRSAVYQSATPSRRHAAHRALASVLDHDPDRRAWHRAASTVGPDDEVAAELEQAASRAGRRGVVFAAVAALERSAQLSGSVQDRWRRLVRAAELALDAGRAEEAERLLREARGLPAGSGDRLRYEWINEVLDVSMRGGAHRVDALIEMAQTAEKQGNHGLAAQFLLRAGTRCWHLNLGRAAEQRVLAATDTLALAELDPRRIAILAYAAPFERSDEVIATLARRPPRIDDDPADLLLLGHAAACVGAFAEAEIFFAAAADGLRRQGRLAPLCLALSVLAWAALRRSRWSIAKPAAHECVRLAEEMRQPMPRATGLAAQAMMAGILGDEGAAGALATQAEAVATDAGDTIGLAIVQVARSMAEAGAGRAGAAYEALARVYRPGDPAHQLMPACWAVGSLAEVAGQSGHRREARAQLAVYEALVGDAPSAGIRVALAYARAVLADPGETDRLFLAALDEDLDDWPFDYGRIRLAYGSWLRRRQRVTESRVQLRAALAAFDRIGARQWSERARRELRAAGEATASAPVTSSWDRLSPQEMQIAQLAAQGLGNKEIAQRLYLSHRTVGTHLYKIFPKLDVTSRTQLAAVVLASADRSIRAS